MDHYQSQQNDGTAAAIGVGLGILGIVVLGFGISKARAARAEVPEIPREEHPLEVLASPEATLEEKQEALESIQRGEVPEVVPPSEEEIRKMSTKEIQEEIRRINMEMQLATAERQQQLMPYLLDLYEELQKRIGPVEAERQLYEAMTEAERGRTALAEAQRERMIAEAITQATAENIDQIVSPYLQQMVQSGAISPQIAQTISQQVQYLTPTRAVAPAPPVEVPPPTPEEIAALAREERKKEIEKATTEALQQEMQRVMAEMMLATAERQQELMPEMLDLYEETIKRLGPIEAERAVQQAATELERERERRAGAERERLIAERETELTAEQLAKIAAEEAPRIYAESPEPKPAQILFYGEGVREIPPPGVGKYVPLEEITQE